jgi:hypothetical protein
VDIENNAGKKSISTMNRPFKLGNLLAARRRDGHHADTQNGSVYHNRPTQRSVLSKYVRLGLNTIKVISVVAVVVFSLHFAYDYAQERIILKEATHVRVKSLNPLYYEGQPMARDWARNTIKELEYAKHWYECIGAGETMVLLWTVWFFA